MKHRGRKAFFRRLGNAGNLSESPVIVVLWKVLQGHRALSSDRPARGINLKPWRPDRSVLDPYAEARQDGRGLMAWPRTGGSMLGGIRSASAWEQ